MQSLFINYVRATEYGGETGRDGGESENMENMVDVLGLVQVIISTFLACLV